MRSKMNPEETGTIIRQTRTGAILMELREGTKNKEAFIKQVQKTIGDQGYIKFLEQRVEIEIRDLVALTTIEEV